jgi:nitroimidazol reductase NimA-like FMN-containing flavoprotein (pyridoxamine 5'-phosphate oxidase superfamily)
VGEGYMKWIYEIIVEKIPPFSWLPRRYNILLQLLLMETIGLIVAAYYHLSMSIVLYGSLAVLAIVAWSLLLLEIAPTIRKFRFSLSAEENDLIEGYKGTLFHPRRYGSVPGILIFAFAMAFLFLYKGFPDSPYGYDLLGWWFPGVDFRSSGNFPLFLLLSGLFWDLSYRMGLGLYVSLLSLWRSWKLRELSRERERLEYTPRTEIRYLQRLDRYTFLIGGVSLLLLPGVHPNRILSYAIGAYVLSVFLFSFFSSRLLSDVPWLPPDIYSLVEKGKFAYVGCSDSQGMPHVTSVIYVFNGQSIYFVTSVASKKLKNLRQNPKIAFLIDVRDPENPRKDKAVLFQGAAKSYGLRDLPLRFLHMHEARQLFYQKYPKYMRMYEEKRKHLPRAWQMTPIISRILIEVKPENIVYWRRARMVKLPM